MSGKPLCIRTFVEVICGQMKKKVQIKKFDMDKNLFQSDAEAKRNKQETLISGLLNCLVSNLHR